MVSISGSSPVADAALHTRLVDGLRAAVRRGHAHAKPLLLARLGDAAQAFLDTDPFEAAELYNEALGVVAELVEEYPEVDAGDVIRELEAGSSLAFRRSIEAVADDDVPSGLKDALRALASVLEAPDETGVAKAANALREELARLSEEDGGRDEGLLDALAAIDELIRASDGTGGPDGADDPNQDGGSEGWSVVD